MATTESAVTRRVVTALTTHSNYTVKKKEEKKKKIFNKASKFNLTIVFVFVV